MKSPRPAMPARYSDRARGIVVKWPGVYYTVALPGVQGLRSLDGLGRPGDGFLDNHRRAMPLGEEKA
jgi:hypothetical protein